MMAGIIEERKGGREEGDREGREMTKERKIRIFMIILTIL